MLPTKLFPEHEGSMEEAAGVLQGSQCCTPKLWDLLSRAPLLLGGAPGTQEGGLWEGMAPARPGPCSGHPDAGQQHPGVLLSLLQLPQFP